KIADGKSDERLVEYYRYMETGDLQQAMAELKVQINNDPEYPVFQQLQRVLTRRIKQQKDQLNNEKIPLLFRLFGTFGKKWKALVLLSIAALLSMAIVMYIRSRPQTALSEMKEMLTSDPKKAVSLLEEEAKKDDSAKLILGNYYRDTKQNDSALKWYQAASLPAAFSGIGKMYYEKQLSIYTDTSTAKRYFEMALLRGVDTTASTYL